MAFPKISNADIYQFTPLPNNPNPRQNQAMPLVVAVCVISSKPDKKLTAGQ